jgi:O-antigen/teichoic acid export membrane protein
MLGYLFSFLSAPIILAGLGIRQFGIWALTGAIGQYILLLDGFSPSISRFIANDRENRRLSGEYIAMGILSGTLVGAVALAGAIAGAGVLSRTLHGISTSNMRIVCVSAAVLVLSGCLSNVAAAFAIGRCRMVAPNLGLSIGMTINFIASVGAILVGAGLPGYALANAGAGIISALLVTILVIRSEGGIPIAWPARARLREFIGYAVKYQVVRLGDLINYQTDKIVIGFSAGPSAAGAYELANRVAAAARTVGVYPMTALLPTLTADMARSGIEYVRKRYERLTEVTVAFAFPPLVLAAALAPILLGAWLSDVPPYTTAVLAGLSLAYIANVSSGTGYVVGAAAGDPGIAARVAAGTAVANLGFTAALAPVFGVWGVLGGTIVALTGGALVQVVLISRRFSLPLKTYFAAVIPALKVSVLLAVPVAALSYSGVITGRVLQACAVAVLALGYVALYGVWAVRTGRAPESVRRWVRGATLVRLRAASSLGLRRLVAWTRDRRANGGGGPAEAPRQDKDRLLPGRQASR